jgi:hypothetical protein
MLTDKQNKEIRGRKRTKEFSVIMRGNSGGPFVALKHYFGFPLL